MYINCCKSRGGAPRPVKKFNVPDRLGTIPIENDIKSNTKSVDTVRKPEGQNRKGRKRGSHFRRIRHDIIPMIIGVGFGRPQLFKTSDMATMHGKYGFGDNCEAQMVKVKGPPMSIAGGGNNLRMASIIICSELSSMIAAKATAPTGSRRVSFGNSEMYPHHSSCS